MKKQFKGRKKMKDGWSPTYCVLCTQLDAFELIQKHLLAQGSKHRWRNESARRIGIRKILKGWADAADVGEIIATYLLVGYYLTRE